MKKQDGMGNLLLCQVRCLWLCCNLLLFCSTKILSELWKLLLLRWLKSIWSLSSLSQEIHVCLMNLWRNCSRGCALSIPCPAQALLEGASAPVPLLGEGGGDSWGRVDGLSCSCCQLWVYPVCVWCQLPVWVCLRTRASKGHKWLEGVMIYPPLFPVTHLVFLCTKRFKCCKCFCPSLLRTHRGFTWLNFMGWCSTKDAAGC